MVHRKDLRADRKAVDRCYSVAKLPQNSTQVPSTLPREMVVNTQNFVAGQMLLVIFSKIMWKRRTHTRSALFAWKDKNEQMRLCCFLCRWAEIKKKNELPPNTGKNNCEREIHRKQLACLCPQQDVERSQMVAKNINRSIQHSMISTVNVSRFIVSLLSRVKPSTQ